MAMQLKNFLKRYPWRTEHLISGKPLEFCWSFKVKANRKVLWTYFSNTSKLNHALGLGKKNIKEVNGKILVQETINGLRQEWIEEPWSWVENQEILIHRKYNHGFARFFRVIYKFLATENPNETQVIIYFGIIPKNILWRTLLTIGIGNIKKRFASLLTDIEDSGRNSAQESEQKSSKSPTNVLPLNAGLRTLELREFKPDFEERLTQIKIDLLKRNIPETTIDRLYDFIRNGDTEDLFRIRLAPLARMWNIKKREMLKAGLHATRLGLFNLSWDVVCPHCRGVRYSATALGYVKSKGNCDVCQIDFQTDSPNSLEVTFSLHRSIGQVPEVLYCVAEASKKPHIKVQQVLVSGEKTKIALSLNEANYRLRTIGKQAKETLINVSADNPACNIVWNPSVSSPSEFLVSRDLEITLINSGPDTETFILEELRWFPEITRPKDLFGIQEFRDLFSEEHLAVDVKLDIGEQVILFTDIVGSTKFYETSGDAKAFAEVRRHFKTVCHEISESNGVLVKTVGDAVMAAFARPEDGLKAALNILKQFPGTTNSASPLRLRISMHIGTVIAVPYNTGIDYFGRVVNFAAKLQACAESSEIALSERIYNKLKAEVSTSRCQVRTTEIQISGRDEPNRVYVLDANEISSQKAS